MPKKPTKEQKQELMEIIKGEPRTYSVSIWGYGGEIVMGRITEDQYEFWSNREDLDEHVHDWEDQMSVPDDLKLVEDGSWYDRDDLIHENGCEFSDLCHITVYDENDNEIWSSSLSYESLEKNGVDTEGIAAEEYYVQYDSDAEYVFLGQSIEKGTFFTGTIETLGKFDPKKLSFSHIDIEGWDIVNGVSYESVIIDDTGGYDTVGKSSDFRVFQVER